MSILKALTVVIASALSLMESLVVRPLASCMTCHSEKGTEAKNDYIIYKLDFLEIASTWAQENKAISTLHTQKQWCKVNYGFG